MTMPLIECVPNLSEGRRTDVVDRLAGVLRRTNGVRLLDYSADPSHHRSVFTIVGEAAPLRTAILALYDEALPLIDLRTHTGEHPRIGAIDVVPFIPLDGTDMSTCVALAEEVAAAVAERHALPVYLYEAAAREATRARLENIRRGGFEGLTAKMREPGWVPDFGPSAPHPTAGASAIGARELLIAYNIYLDTDRLEVAKLIAAAVRYSSGGLRHVKAMGVWIAERRVAQVSMNLTDYRQTPIHRAFDLVEREASRYGVNILESEIIGLVPADALTDAAAHYLQLHHFSSDQVLERKLRHP